MFDHTQLKVYYKGEFINFKDATVSIGNTAFMYGLATFSGIRAHYNAKEDKLYVFRVNDHYKRMYNGAKMLFFNNFLAEISEEKFMNIILELLRVNNIKQDAYIRASIFIDELSIGPKLGTGYKDAFCVFLYPMGDYVPTGGMKCITSSFTRVSDNALPARLKVNAAYVNTALAKTEAVQQGADEAIVLDRDGHAVEGSAENLFIVRDGKLITPSASSDILEGITRDTVIKVAKDLGYEVIERSIDRTELYFADEIILTGTGARVSPVTELDKRKIGNGEIGEIGKVLQQKYTDIVYGNDQRYSDWLTLV